MVYFRILGALWQLGQQNSEKWLREQDTMDMLPPPVGVPCVSRFGTTVTSSKASFLQLIEEVLGGKPHFRLERRMTVSPSIDDVIHEILDYSQRDFINSWYKRISDDGQFRYEARSTVQGVISTFSERYNATLFI